MVDRAAAVGRHTYAPTYSLYAKSRGERPSSNSRPIRRPQESAHANIVLQSLTVYIGIETEGLKAQFQRRKTIPEPDTYCIEGINQQIPEMANRSTK